MARNFKTFMDMADVIVPFSEIFKVEVLSVVADEDGVQVEKVINEFKVKGSLQPISRKLNQEDYGNWHRGSWNLYTYTKIPVNIQDSIRINTTLYRVVEIKDWLSYGYCKYILEERRN